jgi:ribosome biogenesis GTPase
LEADMTLVHFGWAEPFSSAFDALSLEDPGLFPARVASAQREHYVLWGESGTASAAVSGRLRHHAASGHLPVVGDWVAARWNPAGGSATIHAVLPRRGALVRRQAGRSSEPQLIAANLDCVFIVSSLNHDWNPRRLERALALVWEAGAQPVLLLTKLDLCQDLESILEAARSVAPAVPIHALSVYQQLGLDAITQYASVGRTIALLGSSGVGKTTLVNSLLGEARLVTGAIRSGDDRGRHTTSHRELFALPQGGVLIDTPGLRELGLFDTQAGLAVAFDDVARVAGNCRFADCGHADEPGCAVKAELAAGTLDPERYRSFLKLQREEAHQARRTDLRQQTEHKNEIKRRHRRLRDHYKHRD